MSDQINVAVSGIRQFDDCEIVFDKLDRILGKLSKPLHEILISDEAGIAAIVRQYCKAREIRCRVVKTDWENNGDLAAIKRNQELLQNSKLLIVFNDGKDPYVARFVDQALTDRVHTKIFTVIRTEGTFHYTEEV